MTTRKFKNTHIALLYRGSADETIAPGLGGGPQVGVQGERVTAVTEVGKASCELRLESQVHGFSGERVAQGTDRQSIQEEGTDRPIPGP